MRHTLLFLAFLTVGCGGGDRVLLGPPPSGPAAGALAVAPVRVSYEATRDRPRVEAGEVPLGSHHTLTCAACEEDQRMAGLDLVPPCPECGHQVFTTPFVRPLRPALDAAAITAELRDALAARGGFAQVVALDASDDPVAAARAAGAELLLELALTDARCELTDTNWIQPFKYVVLIASSILILPAVDPLNWVLAGELYGLEVRARWRLRDLASGALVGEGELAPQIVEPFAAFGLGVGGRPWFLVGFIRVPECLDEADWEVIAGQLQDAAQDDVARAAVLAAEAATR